MDPRQFCSWFQGVLDMGEQSDGGGSFDAEQMKKIREKLAEALNTPPPHSSGSSGYGGEPVFRC